MSTTDDKKNTINDPYIFNCPHCNDIITVDKNQLNCKIFRHGAFRNNANNPIPPHTPKVECDRLFNNGLIFGCGKPFQFDGATVTICDYI